VRFPGGQAGLQQLLRHRFEELGGTLLSMDGLPASSLPSLAMEGGQPVGLDVSGSEATHRASFILSALDDVELRPLLPASPHPAKPGALQGAMATRAVLAVHWVLPPRALPQGLGEVVLVDLATPVGACLVQVGPVRRPEGRGEEPGLRLVTAAAFVPPEVEPGLVAAQAIRVEEALERLMPFSRVAVVARSVPQLDAPHRTPGALLHPLLPTDARAAWEGSGLPVTTPWRSVLRAGREVAPGLGLEGEVLAALGAVARVQRATQKRSAGKR